MEGLVMAAQMLLGISILVGLHEAGHMLAAKAFGMRVEKFSIGFPPKLFGFKYGETEYSLGALPLGGFVKITGMIDESLDTERMKRDPEPYEFRAKPAWQRLIVMMGGIIMNVLLGILIFVVITYRYGQSYVPREEVVEHGIVAYELGEALGLQTGDRILKVNGRPYERFDELINPTVFFEDNSSYTVLRDSDTLNIKIPVDFLDRMSTAGKDVGLFYYRQPFRVDQVVSGTPADSIGLQAGDRIIGVNQQSITYFNELQEALDEYKGQKIDLKVLRDEGEIVLHPIVTEEGTLGFQVKDLINYGSVEFSFLESIPRGTKMAFDQIGLQIMAFKKIFSGELNFQKSVIGPIGIAKSFGGEIDWLRFWTLVGLISMILAFMNFLPIPALDGGHVAFLTYEIISGRKPSDKFLENAQKVGMVLLLTLMVFILGNDIFKEFIN